jgi:hypothetical protein
VASQIYQKSDSRQP